MDQYNFFRQFHDITKADYELLTANLQTKKFRKGEILIRPGQVQKELYFVKSGVQRIKLHFNDVTHIQGLKDYAIIYTYSGKILLKGSIKAMLDIFPQDRFIRVHKSFIVSIQKITRLQRSRIVLDGHQIPIGRNFKDNLEKALNI